MLFSNQTFLVAGFPARALPRRSTLLQHGAKVYCFDDAEEGGVPAAKRALSDKGCRIVAKEELSARAEECDILVLSPGIPIDHPLPLLFRRQKKRVMGEMELGALALRSPAVAVTGTNGKTTTVTHARGRLSGGGAEEPPLREHRASSVCGRAGSHGGCCRPHRSLPPFSWRRSPPCARTLPSSSTSPRIISNRHYNMENYIYLKRRLLKNCTESEYAVPQLR